MLIRYILIISLIFSFNQSYSFNKESSDSRSTIKVSIAEIPFGTELMILLTEEMAKETNQNIEIDTFPFVRSISNISSKSFDLHIPLIKPVKGLEKLNYSFSEAVIFYVDFYLYMNKKKLFKPSEVNKYDIYTDAGHINLFDFNISGTTNLEALMDQLEVSRVDGIIFSGLDMNELVKKNKYKNIVRVHFKRYPVHAVIQKGSNGNHIDQWISRAIKKIKEGKKYKKIFGGAYHLDVNEPIRK